MTTGRINQVAALYNQ